jgi:hypothetical protein
MIQSALPAVRIKYNWKIFPQRDPISLARSKMPPGNSDHTVRICKYCIAKFIHRKACREEIFNTSKFGAFFLIGGIKCVN